MTSEALRRVLICAAAVSACFVLTGCLTASQANDVIQDVAPSIQIVVDQDAQAGLIDKSVASAVDAYVPLVEQASASLAAGSSTCSGGNQACALANLSAAVATADQLLAQPAAQKAIGAAAGPRVAAALDAAKRAILAAQDAQAAASATALAQKNAEALAALFQLNAAILAGVQAAA